MERPIDRDAARLLFVTQLPTIKRAIRFVCRRGRVPLDEFDDFASQVTLKLIQDDYAVIRAYDRKSTFAAFIAVVVHRMLIDHRITHWGKWHASAHARRLGDAAVAVEALAIRDGKNVAEILPAISRRWPQVGEREIEEIVRGLPVRSRRPRLVELELAAEIAGASAESVHDAAFQSRRIALANRITQLIRAAMTELSDDDRLLLQLHYEGRLSVAEISRSLHVEQKPLYRRLKRALRALRERLEQAGITSSEIDEVLKWRDSELDLGLASDLAPLGTDSSNEEEEGE